MFGRPSDERLHGQMWSVPSLLQDKTKQVNVLELISVVELAKLNAKKKNCITVHIHLAYSFSSEGKISLSASPFVYCHMLMNVLNDVATLWLCCPGQTSLRGQ